MTLIGVRRTLISIGRTSSDALFQYFLLVFFQPLTPIELNFAFHQLILVEYENIMDNYDE